MIFYAGKTQIKMKNFKNSQSNEFKNKNKGTAVINTLSKTENS